MVDSRVARYAGHNHVLPMEHVSFSQYQSLHYKQLRYLLSYLIRSFGREYLNKLVPIDADDLVDQEWKRVAQFQTHLVDVGVAHPQRLVGAFDRLRKQDSVNHDPLQPVRMCDAYV